MQNQKPTSTHALNPICPTQVLLCYRSAEALPQMAMVKQVLDSNCTYSIDAVCAPPPQPEPKAAAAEEADAPDANGGGSGGGGGGGAGAGGAGVGGNGEVDSDADENGNGSGGDVTSMISASDLVVIFDLNPLCLKPEPSLESRRSSLGSPVRRGLARPHMKPMSPKSNPSDEGADSSSADTPMSPTHRRARQRWRAAAAKVRSPIRAPASPFANGAAGGEAGAEDKQALGACSGILKTITSVEPTKACFVVYIEPAPSSCATDPAAEIKAVQDPQRRAEYRSMETVGDEQWVYGSSVPSTLVHNIANALQKAVDKAAARAAAEAKAAAVAAQLLSPRMLGNAGRRPSILRGGVEWTKSRRSIGEGRFKCGRTPSTDTPTSLAPSTPAPTPAPTPFSRAHALTHTRACNIRADSMRLSDGRISERKDISFGGVDMRFFGEFGGRVCGEDAQ